jgi:hypothetical protein
VSVSIYDGKKLVTTEELVISEKMILNKEWFMKYLPLSQHNIKVLMLCLPKTGRYN